MGIPSANGNELASMVVSGTFTATGNSGNAVAYNGPGQPKAGISAVLPLFVGVFNAALWGTFVATMQLQCSFDGGTNWVPISEDTSGTPANYTAPMKLEPYECEQGVLYRWACTSYSSGTVNYRLSQSTQVFDGRS